MPVAERSSCRRYRVVAALVATLAAGALGEARAQYAAPSIDSALPARAPAISTRISGQLLWTNNVELNEQRESDFIVRVTPAVDLNYRGDRAQLSASFALPLILHTRKADDSDARPELNAHGRLEVVDDFFFVDADARVYTLYDNPFGARPVGIENVVDNQSTSQWYSVTPFIRGQIGGNVRYHVADSSAWTRGDRETYTNIFTATIERDPLPFGWGFDASRRYYDFDLPGNRQVVAIARARGIWQATADLRVHASGGYEDTELPLSSFGGAIYGAGFLWRPTPRTVLDVNWEERFFGPSYRVVFEHRWPRAVWDVRLSRDISSYPELVATLPENSFVPLVLDRFLLSRIPDPFERLQFIRTFMEQRGLSLFTQDATAIYARKVYLVERASTTAGLFGARNSLLVTGYYLQTEPVPGDELLDPLLDIVDTRQVGVTANWSYQLSGQSTLTLTGNAHETTRTRGTRGESDQWSVRLNLSRELTPRTHVYAGARYQSFRSDFGRNYDEAAVFVGASHRFE